MQLNLFQPPPPVTLAIRWEDLLGNRPASMPETERRQRWATWLRLARLDDRDQAEWWNDAAECAGCINRKGGWCKLIGLPCSVNPYLTFRHGQLGFACAGVGYDDGLPPIEGPANKNEIPF